MPRYLRTAALLLAAACGGSGPVDDDLPVASIVIEPAEPSVAAGATLRLEATLLDANGDVVTGPAVTWTTAGDGIATVDQTGEVTGVAPGTVAIGATAESVTGTATLTVTAPAVATIAVSPGSTALVPGQDLQLVATPRDAGGHPIEGVTLTWTTSNAARATVSSAGLVHAVAPGAVTLTAAVEGRSGTATVNVQEGGLVGPEGGAVSAFGGAVTLTVPAGALSSPVPFVVQPLGGAPLDPTAAGAGYLIGPAGTVLAEPATLAIVYDPASGPRGVAETAFGLRRLSAGVWQPADELSVDPAAHAAQGSIGAVGGVGVGRIPPAEPCPDPQHRQFDFWLGSWDVAPTGAPPDARKARSEITQEAGGCAIFEDFTDLGVHGVSINVYEPESGQWFQTYVDNTGLRLELIGGLTGPAMLLINEAVTERITWTPGGGGSVRQLGETSANGGGSWSPTFDLTYQPR